MAADIRYSAVRLQ